jgi:predicted glycoside hydrolase/deacetylase ChbG (UPF0249 family)
LKQLIVTADDAGLDPGMTAGAIEAHRNGIVTACSLVANGRAFDDAVARLRDTLTLEVGVHLTLVEERSLTTGETMPRNWMRYLVSRRGDVEGELRLQIEKVLAAGLRVTHLNSHQHLHMLPSIRRIVTALATEYRIPYVRRVRDRGGPFGLRKMIFAIGGGQPPRLSTIGVVEAGHLTSDRIIALLDEVKETTELVTHPGLNVSGYSHWRYDWERETRALCDPRVRQALHEKGIRLTAPSEALI